MCGKCHWRLLPTKPMWQAPTASVRELLLGGLETRNSMLNSGQPEPEGFASSAKFQATFCKTGISPQGFSSLGKCHCWCLCIPSKQRQCRRAGGVCGLRAEVATASGVSEILLMCEMCARLWGRQVPLQEAREGCSLFLQVMK